MVVPQKSDISIALLNETTTRSHKKSAKHNRGEEYKTTDSNSLESKEVD